MEHNCEKMNSEQAFKYNDLSFIKFYFDTNLNKTIYYCDYCGKNFIVKEE